MMSEQYGGKFCIMVSSSRHVHTKYGNLTSLGLWSRKHSRSRKRTKNFNNLSLFKKPKMPSEAICHRKEERVLPLEDGPRDVFKTFHFYEHGTYYIKETVLDEHAH